MQCPTFLNQRDMVTRSIDVKRCYKDESRLQAKQEPAFKQETD